MKVYRIYVDLFPDSTPEQRRDVFNGIAELVGEQMGDTSKSVYSHGWIEDAFEWLQDGAQTGGGS